MKFSYVYPILLTTYGVFIHAFGLLGIEYLDGPGIKSKEIIELFCKGLTL